MGERHPDGLRAFVLGGGGVLGAHEVGMLRALAEAQIVPDLVLGTSIGAVNGALFAAEPGPAGVQRLIGLWSRAAQEASPAGALLRRLGTLARTGTHVESVGAIKQRLRSVLPVERIEQLSVPHVPLGFGAARARCRGVRPCGRSVVRGRALERLALRRVGRRRG